MIVDEDFFINKLGNLEFIEKVDEINPSGVFITDYVADALILINSYSRGKQYKDLLGLTYFSPSIWSRGFINGIIKTNYKEKYKNSKVLKF